MSTSEEHLAELAAQRARHLGAGLIVPALDRVTTSMSQRVPIEYHRPALYVRCEAGVWSSFGPMPLYRAVLLAIRKYRINHEPCILAEELSLIGIDSILAVRQRPDFPLLVADTPSITRTIGAASTDARRHR